jgi:hypothetical protein
MKHSVIWLIDWLIEWLQYLSTIEIEIWSINQSKQLKKYQINESINQINQITDNIVKQSIKITKLNNQWQVGGYLRVLRFPPPINLTTTI